MNKTLTKTEDIQLKRLRFRSWHRGCKETDLVLGNFAQHMLNYLNNEEIALYEALLDEDDVLIWDWLTDKSTDAFSKKYQPLKEKIRACTPTL